MDASTSTPERQSAPRHHRRVRRVAFASVLLGGVPLAAAPAFAASSSSYSAYPLATSAFDVSAIAAKVDPAIVDINTTLPNGAAAGTGMVLTSSGEVLTNNHVIAGATDIRVQIAGTGPSFTATVLGYDVADDVALLQLEGASNLTTISAGDPTQLGVGDPVLALGNALGQGGTPAAAAGSVTALGQTITATDDGGANAETLTGMIETDAAIQPGDSGGPLAIANGEVVGMDSAGSSNSQLADEATDGFAIPIDKALAIVHQIESGRSSTNVHLGSRAILGVEIDDSSAASTPESFFGGWGAFGGDAGTSSEVIDGVQVAGVQPGGPADDAGLAAADTITSVGGTSVSTSDDLSGALAAHQPGDHVRVGWTDSAGQDHAETVTLVAGPPA